MIKSTKFPLNNIIKYDQIKSQLSKKEIINSRKSMKYKLVKQWREINTAKGWLNMLSKCINNIDKLLLKIIRVKESRQKK